MQLNINYIVKQKICTGCGACLAVCKSEAIIFEETISGNFFPKIDKGKCNNCGLCLRVCPQANFNNQLLSNLPLDPFVGSSIQSFIGKAKDKKIFNNSQSGGIVSALLCYLLDAKIVDAAITVKMEWGNPPRPKIWLAKKSDEVGVAQKSKYAPMPVLKAFKRVQKNNQKVVVVGLSCHIHGLCNLCEIIPELKDRVVLTIGLFCDRVMKASAINYLINKVMPHTNKEKMFCYRDKQNGGYPGSVSVRYPDEKKYTLSSKTRAQIKDYFTPICCRLCFDKMNIFSDIAVGDPWGIAGADYINGESVCVARNKKGLTFVKSANKYITVRNIKYSKIIAGQKIKEKRKDWYGYTKAWQELKFPTPNFYHKIAKIKKINFNIKKYSKNIKKAIFLDRLKTEKAIARYVNWNLFKKNFIKFKR